MSLANIDALTNSVGVLNSRLGTMNTYMKGFNQVVSKLTTMIDRNVRAQTKVVAAASRTHGIMMGVVADLELMGGAFGKIKAFLSNLFMPIDADLKKRHKIVFKTAQAMSSYSNMFSAFHDIVVARKKTKPQREAKKQEKEQVKQIKRDARLRTEVETKLYSSMNRNRGLVASMSRLNMGQKQTRIAQWGVGPFGRGRMMTVQEGKGATPPELMGLSPEFKPSRLKRMATGVGKAGRTIGSGVSAGIKKVPTVMKGVATIGSGAVVKGMTLWKKNVTTPLKQIASGGIGLGFQTTIIMGLMQAFSQLFNIFQPIIEVVGLLMERLSVGFMPLIQMVMDILTSEPVLAMIDMLSQFLMQLFSAFEPLVPIIIMLIEMAMIPLMAFLDALTPIFMILADVFVTIMVALMPLVELLMGSLAPVFEVLAKVIGLLIVLSLYPLIGVLYGIGVFIAGLIDVFTGGTAGAMNAWNNLMLPIFTSLNVATTTILGSFQTGTEYVPKTGIYLLHKGEEVRTSQDARKSNIIINLNGSFLGADMDELTSIVARKLDLHRW